MAGTPLYLAPELFDGRPATRASDIYSLGVLLYRMVTREYPVEGADRSQIERAHREGRVKRLRDARPDLPSEFIQTVERALSPDPAARPQTAGELEAALTSKRSSDDRFVDVVASARRLSPPQSSSWPSRVGVVPDQPGKSPDTNDPSPAAAVERTPAPRRQPQSILPILVKARLFRTRNGVETPLTAGTESRRRATSSRCSVEASMEVYVYVLNADDAGSRTACSHCPTTNRTIPSRRPRYTGCQATSAWIGSVTSAGGREHFVIMVTPVRNEPSRPSQAIAASEGRRRP